MSPDSKLIRAALEPLLHGQSLSMPEMQAVMLDIMQGHANDAQISAFLVALRIKGESVAELEGSVRAIQSRPYCRYCRHWWYKSWCRFG
jgi:anthranilate phosphoribosyltransferase